MSIYLLNMRILDSIGFGLILRTVRKKLHLIKLKSIQVGGVAK